MSRGTEVVTKTITPSSIFKNMKLDSLNFVEAEKVLSVALNTLIRLNVGDVLETSSGTFSKIASDLVHVDTDLNQSQIVDSLEKRKIIKFTM